MLHKKLCVGLVHARSLTRAHKHVYVQSCTCPPEGFCIAPDTIAYAESVRSGEYCMADTIASDTGLKNCKTGVWFDL